MSVCIFAVFATCDQPNRLVEWTLAGKHAHSTFSKTTYHRHHHHHHHHHHFFHCHHSLHRHKYIDKFDSIGWIISTTKRIKGSWNVWYIRGLEKCSKKCDREALTNKLNKWHKLNTLPEAKTMREKERNINNNYNNEKKAQQTHREQYIRNGCELCVIFFYPVAH